MSATAEELDHLQAEIAKGTEETKSYLAQVRDKLEAYDAQYKVSETASGYMQSGLDRAHAAVDDLKAVGSRLSDRSKDTSAAVVGAAHASLHQVHAALAALKDRAVDYDQRVKATVAGGASAVKGTVATSIETIVTTTRSGAAYGVDTVSSALQSVQNAIATRAMAAGHRAFATAGTAIKAAEGVDQSVGVSTMVTNVVTGVTERVVDLDKKLGVSETALKVDAKVSGGMGANLVQKGVGLVQNSVEYVRETITQAKAAADEGQVEEKNGEAKAEVEAEAETKAEATEKKAETEKATPQ